MLVLKREAVENKYGINHIKSKKINLTCMRLTKIDSNAFKELTNLEIMWLFSNHITEIDNNSFVDLSNLTELRLYNNRLRRIDSNMFRGLIKLERLFLENNEIAEIDADSFDDLSNLLELRLFDNKLKRIDSLFKPMTKLRGLWLFNNELTELDVNLFDGLVNLKVLCLDKNKLRKIDGKCFEPLKTIEVIQLFDNDNLNVLSLFIPSTELTSDYYDRYKLEKYGFVSNRSKFLSQFDDTGLQPEARENEGEKIVYEVEIRRENSDKEIFKKFDSSSSGSDRLSQHRISIEDPYIGKIFNDRYEVEKRIGKGAYGSVYLVNDKNIQAANKIRRKAMKIMDDFSSATGNELELFWLVIHENIVRYFDHFHLKIGDDNLTFLITEYCENGDLKNKIDEAKRMKRGFSDGQIFKWMCEATKAIDYLHSKQPPIIHRDIKPANMLLTGKDEIKIGDLGVAKMLEKSHASTRQGTPVYMSPEVFMSQIEEVKYYPNTDIWSLGCVLYELIFLELAFPRGQKGNPPIPSNASTSGIFSLVLPKMLEKDYLVRVTSKKLISEFGKLFDRKRSIEE